ncbi:MAG: Shedu anti-phage system protein SduA domain-containing protein [bacterium]
MQQQIDRKNKKNSSKSLKQKSKQSTEITKAITQATRYIYEVEREANSVKFLERMDNVKTIKPRCILIFGRSNNWNDEQKEAYRILNSSYHNLMIMTYDHVLLRAKRILNIDTPEDLERNTEGMDDVPF